MMSLGGNLCLSWSNFVHDIASKKYVFILRNSTFSPKYDPLFGVKSIPPNTDNSMQYGYDENDNNNMSNETKRETNYSTPMTTFTQMFAWCT